MDDDRWERCGDGSVAASVDLDGNLDPGRDDVTGSLIEAARKPPRRHEGMTPEQVEAVEEWESFTRLIAHLQAEKRLVYKTCRDLGLDFVMHRSGQDRWPRGEFGDWRAL